MAGAPGAPRRQLSAFTGTDREREQDAAGERDKQNEAEADAEQESADLMAYSAREHAIHEAYKHAEKANELAKEAAEVSLASADEAMQARRVLDQHDIIAIESQTQADVRKAEVARGLTESMVPWPLLAMPSLPRGHASFRRPARWADQGQRRHIYVRAVHFGGCADLQELSELLQLSPSPLLQEA